MELRYDRTYPRCHVSKQYTAYRRFVRANTARGRKLAGLPVIPLELQRMIIREALRDPTASLQDYASYLHVCRSWHDPVKKFATTQYATVLKRLEYPGDRLNASLYVFVTYFRYSALWAQFVRRVLRLDTEIRTRLVYEAVRDNNIDAARILFGECGVDAKEEFPQGMEDPLYGPVRTAMHTACLYSYTKMIKLLADKFGVLDGKCKFYIMNLILIVVDQGNVDAWITLNRCMNRAPE